MDSAFALRLRGLVRKSPAYVARRALRELGQVADRWVSPIRAKRIDASAFLRELACGSIDEAWNWLIERPYPLRTAPIDRPTYDRLSSGDSERIMAAAERALAHEVDLLGSGPTQLGSAIDWHRDYKTGARWPAIYFRRIDYARLGEPCDVKFPWELSRLQWLIPAGQAYVLTGDERYAAACRNVLEQWISANPYAFTVNWGVAMEAALRIFSWTWFFRIFGRSRSWSDAAFRERFLVGLYQHADFVERYIEVSDVNGNHFTADLAGLAVAGNFFGRGAAAQRWSSRPWIDLQRELERQVHSDGVDFEASVPYHRLVLELFAFPALHRRSHGLAVPAEYLARLRAMASFIVAYTRPDGIAPAWGDNDDARTLPFTEKGLVDHRYLVALIAHLVDDDALAANATDHAAELFWLLGNVTETRCSSRPSEQVTPRSASFPEGGVFVMRNTVDHVFIDCGPIGLGGRGGHGHNDALSFEAYLNGTELVTDSGCFVYTASIEERNLFRSTQSHNTPLIDGEEINRLFRPDFLWTLRDDARPTMHAWTSGPDFDVFRGAHAGYRRLQEPVTPIRRIVLDHRNHSLTIEDSFEGVGSHAIKVPYHIAPGIVAMRENDQSITLRGFGRSFRLSWRSESPWSVEIGQGRMARRYGVVERRVVILFSIVGALPAPLEVRFEGSAE